MAGKTIFEKILSKELPAKVVFEDDIALAFHDINPQAPVHVLVIPKQKLVGFSDVKSGDAKFVGLFMQRVSQVAQQLGLDERGYRIVFNQGRDGNQTVDYLHAHILGGRRLGWPPG